MRTKKVAAHTPTPVHLTHPKHSETARVEYRVRHRVRNAQPYPGPSRTGYDRRSGISGHRALVLGCGLNFEKSACSREHLPEGVAIHPRTTGVNEIGEGRTIGEIREQAGLFVDQCLSRYWFCDVAAARQKAKCKALISRRVGSMGFPSAPRRIDATSDRDRLGTIGTEGGGGACQWLRVDEGGTDAPVGRSRHPQVRSAGLR